MVGKISENCLSTQQLLSNRPTTLRTTMNRPADVSNFGCENAQFLLETICITFVQTFGGRITSRMSDITVVSCRHGNSRPQRQRCDCCFLGDITPLPSLSLWLCRSLTLFQNCELERKTLQAQHILEVLHVFRQLSSFLC